MDILYELSPSILRLIKEVKIKTAKNNKQLPILKNLA